MCVYAPNFRKGDRTVVAGTRAVGAVLGFSNFTMRCLSERYLQFKSNEHNLMMIADKRELISVFSAQCGVWCGVCVYSVMRCKPRVSPPWKGVVCSSFDKPKSCKLGVCMCMCMRMCMYVYVCMCICVCICVCVCTWAHRPSLNHRS